MTDTIEMFGTDPIKAKQEPWSIIYKVDTMYVKSDIELVITRIKEIDPAIMATLVTEGYAKKHLLITFPDTPSIKEAFHIGSWFGHAFTDALYNRLYANAFKPNY